MIVEYTPPPEPKPGGCMVYYTEGVPSGIGLSEIGSVYAL